MKLFNKDGMMSDKALNINIEEAPPTQEKGLGIAPDPLSDFDKSHTIIFGSTRTGKSLFLRQEANRLGIPYDQLLVEVILTKTKKRK